MKHVKTFNEYINDNERVSPAQRDKINFEIELIGKIIEAREERGLSQRELSRLSGVKQPAIARIESMRSTPQIDTLFKVLNPLGYKLSIVPIHHDNNWSRKFDPKRSFTGTTASF